MNDKIKQHLIAVAEKNNWPTDNDTLIEILTEAEEVYVKKVSDSRWWYTEFIVANVDGMLIGYEYAKANRDESVRDLGWEFDETTICEVEAVQETVTVYRKLNPLADSPALNTMNNFDPNAPKEQEAAGAAAEVQTDNAGNGQAAEGTPVEEKTEE